MSIEELGREYNSEVVRSGRLRQDIAIERSLSAHFSGPEAERTEEVLSGKWPPPLPRDDGDLEC